MNELKFSSFLALILPAIALFAIPFLGDFKSGVIVALFIAMFALGANTGGDMPLVSEVAPDIAGTLFGVTNTMASAMGIGAPMLSALLLESGVGFHSLMIDQYSNKYFSPLIAGKVHRLEFNFFLWRSDNDSLEHFLHIFRNHSSSILGIITKSLQERSFSGNGRPRIEKNEAIRDRT